MDAASPDYLTGVAAWENPWPYEDLDSGHALNDETGKDGRSLPGGTPMLETHSEPNAQAGTWHPACALDDIGVGSGTCVLVGDRQIALFRVDPDQVRAVQNQCPHRGSAVLHQGLVGDREGKAAVFCPLHKRAYGLHDGICLDGDDARLRVYPARVVAGSVEILV